MAAPKLQVTNELLKVTDTESTMTTEELKNCGLNNKELQDLLGITYPQLWKLQAGKTPIKACYANLIRLYTNTHPTLKMEIK